MEDFTHSEADPSMEEAKAASYYDELTRKGKGAARFKQGLGFSSSSSVPFPSKPSSSPSSLFSSFVRATSPDKAEKQAQLETIQAKLRRSHRSSSPKFRSSEHRCRSPVRDDCARRRSCSRERRRERDRGCRSRSRDRRRRSKSYSEDEVENREGHRRNRNGRRDRDGSRRRSRSRSPSRISSIRDLKKDQGRDERRRQPGISAEKGDTLDYALLIEGYSQMTPAERVRAKMKLQLSQTAAKDSTMGMSSGWERFDFNKDAPLDDDNDEIEVAEDDASLVKEIGNSFRFSAVQAKREEQIKVAHDEAMFGASAMAPTVPEPETIKDAEKTNNENQDNNLLISDKVLTMQQGSWRDRVGRFKSGFN